MLFRSPRELLLRINRSLERRPGGQRPTSIVIESEVRLDLLERAICTNNQLMIGLSNREFRTLRLLVENKNDVIARTFISREILGRRVIGQSRSVDMLVSSVRRKLVKCKANVTIRSVRGEGYALSIPVKRFETRP